MQKDDIFVRRAELAEYAQERLDRKLRQLGRGDTVTVTWFRPKPGADSADIGQYMTVTGVVERIDLVSRALFLGRRRIPMEDISELRGERLDEGSEAEAATASFDILPARCYHPRENERGRHDMQTEELDETPTEDKTTQERYAERELHLELLAEMRLG